MDPGSLVWENPGNFGYKIFYRTLKEHRQALTQLSWKHILNYETKWMNRDEHVECIYDAALALNRTKAKHGVISREMMKKEEKQISGAQKYMRQIEKIAIKPDKTFRKTNLRQLELEAKRYANTPGSQIRELQWPTRIFNIRVPQILRTLLFGNSTSRVSPLSILGLIIKISFLQGERLLRQVLPSKS